MTFITMLIGLLVWLILPMIALVISAAMYLREKKKLRHEGHKSA